MNYKNLSTEELHIQREGVLNEYQSFLQEAIKIAQRLKELRQILINIDDEIKCREQAYSKEKTEAAA